MMEVQSRRSREGERRASGVSGEKSKEYISISRAGIVATKN
jgi:hypothetical protein